MSKEQIESGMEYIESPEELNLNFDLIDFEEIESVSIEEVENVKVYDLEIKNNHTYQVDGLGLVHNGGGKL